MDDPPPAPAAMPPRQAIVIVAPWPYHPTCGIGGGVQCFGLLERLARSFDVHFVSFDEVPHDLEGGRRLLGRLCASVTLVPTPPVRRGLADRWFQAMQVIRRAPREVRDIESPMMANTIAQLVARHAPVAVLLQFPQMAQFADAARPAAVVMDTQDVALVSRHREWQAARGVAKRLARGIAWAAWARHEMHWYRRCDALLGVSETDLGVLRAFVPDVPSVLVPVATEIREVAKQADGQRVVFIGNFDHAPNRDALLWLREAIWPLIRARCPAAELHVAGPGAPEPTAEDARDGVVMRGFVESLDAFYAAAQVAVVPYRFGGGTKIKALDAMARGCPVVATAVGAEGLKVTPGVQLRQADTPADFADAVAELLLSEPARRVQAEAARAHLARHFSWEAKVAVLEGLLRDLAARQPAVSSR